MSPGDCVGRGLYRVEWTQRHGEGIHTKWAHSVLEEFAQVWVPTSGETCLRQGVEKLEVIWRVRRSELRQTMCSRGVGVIRPKTETRLTANGAITRIIFINKTIL